MKINLKDKNTKEILMFSLLPFGTSTLYTLIGTALNMYFTDVLGLSLAMTSIVLSATKIWDAINDPLMGMIVDKFGYNADLMSKLTNNLAKPLIQSTTTATVIGGVDYTLLLNVVFFMLTALGAVGLLLQAIPMFFYKFDEKAQDEKLKAFRAEKEQRAREELNAALTGSQG